MRKLWALVSTNISKSLIKISKKIRLGSFKMLHWRKPMCLWRSFRSTCTISMSTLSSKNTCVQCTLCMSEWPEHKHQLFYLYKYSYSTPFSILIMNHWGSPYGHWNRIHWIQIPDVDSMWLSCELHKARKLGALHCWTHCQAAQHTAWIRIGGRVKTKCSLDPDPRSASDPDASSRVENPIILCNPIKFSARFKVQNSYKNHNSWCVLSR